MAHGTLKQLICVIFPIPNGLINVIAGASDGFGILNWWKMCFNQWNFYWIKLSSRKSSNLNYGLFWKWEIGANLYGCYAVATTIIRFLTVYLHCPWYFLSVLQYPEISIPWSLKTKVQISLFTLNNIILYLFKAQTRLCSPPTFRVKAHLSPKSTPSNIKSGITKKQISC